MRATRKDDQGRELRLGESQRKGGLYEYRYKDSVGKRHTIYDRDLDNLRLKEAEIQRVHDAGLDYAEGDITVTTFREDDPRGTAARAFYAHFGFEPGALGEEFGHPFQEFILRR